MQVRWQLGQLPNSAPVCCWNSVFVKDLELTPAGRGYFKKFCMWMCLPIFKIMTFTIPYFVHIITNHIPILYKKKTPILLKLGVFYYHLLKIHPIYVNWVPSSVMKKKTIAILKSAKKASQKAGTSICIPCQCEYPLPRISPLLAGFWKQITEPIFQLV